MNLNPYLNFRGDCEAAFRFYERCFGGKILMMMKYEGTPAEADLAAEWQSKIVHARMEVGGALLMGGDGMPEDYEAPKGFDVTLSPATPPEAERIFAALAEGGSVRVPLAETFWAQRFGLVTDRFGIPWMINCEKPM